MHFFFFFDAEVNSDTFFFLLLVYNSIMNFLKNAKELDRRSILKDKLTMWRLRSPTTLNFFMHDATEQQ